MGVASRVLYCLAASAWIEDSIFLFSCFWSLQRLEERTTAAALWLHQETGLDGFMEV